MDAAIASVIERRKDVLLKVKEELIDRLQLDYSPKEIDDDAFLFGSGLSLDSIDAMEIVLGMQACFGVMIPDGETAAMRTVNTLADFVIVEQDAGRC
jgi:acyl carrier protein